MCALRQAPSPPPRVRADRGVRPDGSALGAILSDRVVLGVLAGLVLGKFLGVFGGAWL
ncbi:Na+/H+ antiporter NhaA [Nonomuraea sp. MG754425]|nr:Na+/H+ antiporter NhaA [Nonomuraea sp. MG754425]